MKTFAAWLEEALLSENKPTGPATPMPTFSDGPTLEAFEFRLGTLPELASSLVAEAPWAAELGVSLPCDVAEVKRAFRRLAFLTHPDRPGGSHAGFLRAQELLGEALAWLSGAASQRAHVSAKAYRASPRTSPRTTCAVYA